ncbi:MAG TPA: PAAR domain-containing protein [Noviherbaspirillum sp.]|uniref:PAAR domain-containing protein n=1 Tax=Noviherbaspirillum sp. TaxID=1926288 RepID=UPI002B480AA3|nr:PAAR domain-containing protein [Noviherbaspirillum sp.]HJV85043.1 PAAR domain-containing protein [Noviherbaspirillum sp.]
MTKAFIVVGDVTDHGGKVIGGAATTDTQGKRIARVGDEVTCPKKGHGGTTVIATGDPTVVIDGRPVARHGDRTACGAILIASQTSVFSA